MFRIIAYQLLKGQRTGTPLIVNFTLTDNNNPTKHCDNILRGNKFHKYHTFNLCEFMDNDSDYGYGKGWEPIMAGSID